MPNFQDWFADHPKISYVIILAFTVYIFNVVFKKGRLPILKEIIVYIVMAIGCLVLLVFQIDKLPIIQCMGVAIIMMVMLRLRQLYDKHKNKGKTSEGSEAAADQAETRV